MSFLLPSALLGLLTLLPILLLHLLRNRRQQVAISSLQLWRGLQRKKRGSLPRSIPLSVMLLLQLLAAVALTVGLARPALSFLLAEPRHLILVLDTTSSMLAGGPTAADLSGSRFETARQAARAYLEALPEGDTFVLITLNDRPEIVQTGGSAEIPQALLALDNLVPGATGQDLTASLSLANGMVDPDRETRIIVVTDGSYPVEAGELPVMRAPLAWELTGSPAGNQALLNVSARTLPDGRHRLFARVVNYSDSPVVRTLAVSADGRGVDEATVQLEAQGEAARVWTLPAGAAEAAVELLEPDGLAVDNRAEVLLATSGGQTVLLVSAAPEIMARALAAQPGVKLTVAAPDELPAPAAGLRERLATFDLVVFDGLPLELMDWPGGNLWLLNPPLGHPLLPAQHYTRSLRPDLATVSPLLADINLSGVYFNRATQLALPEWAEADLLAQSPAGSESGQPLIFHGIVDNSRVVVWAFSLEESNLPARLALPLMTANTLTALLTPAPPQTVFLGSPVSLSGDFTVETPAGRRLFLAHTGLEKDRFTHTREPGLYRIYHPNNSLAAGFAVHAGSALESNLAVRLDPAVLEITTVPRPAEAGPETAYEEFWPWLAGLALLVITLEGWLAWRR